MSYQDQLSPWVVHKRMPNFQQTAIARFRNRNDAEAYLKVVSRMMPHLSFTIAFDAHKRGTFAPHASISSRTPEVVANS